MQAKDALWHLIEGVRRGPLPKDALPSLPGVSAAESDALVVKALSEGRIFYFYDVQRMAREYVSYCIILTAHRMRMSDDEALTKYDVMSAKRIRDSLAAVAGEDRQHLIRHLASFSSKALDLPGRGVSRYRLYGVSDQAERIRGDWPEHFAVEGSLPVLVLPKSSRKFIGRPIPATITAENRQKASDIHRKLVEDLEGLKPLKTGRQRRSSARGFYFMQNKRRSLEFYFVPDSPEVLSLLVANSLKLFELAHAIFLATKHSDLTTSLEPWLGWS